MTTILDASELAARAPTAAAFPSRAEFINQWAERFNGNQDAVHNALLYQLLHTDYSEQNLPLHDANPANYPAYAVVRGDMGQTQSPLYRVRTAAQLATVPSSNFFIRDYLQLQTQGGNSAEEPMLLQNHHIVDGVQNSNFVKDFNAIVKAINQHPAQAQSTRKVDEFQQLHHRDAIQLIPYHTDETQRLSPFAGDVLQHVQVHQSRIYSRMSLQGIFAADGAFRDVHITQNRLEVAGGHTLTLYGLLSGTIKGNTDLQGRPLERHKVLLYPLRIGGGAGIYVLGFDNKRRQRDDPQYYDYTTIAGSQAMLDLRRKPYQASGATNWLKVDMAALRYTFRTLWPELKNSGASAQMMQQALQDMMRSIGAVEV